MTEAIDIGSRRELFVDDYLIERMEEGLSLQLHHPVPRGIVLRMDRPWEGNMCGFITVMEDDDRFRMYYKGHKQNLEAGTDSNGHMVEAHPLNVCYAESRDGVNWQRPELGLIEFDGTTANNIITEGFGSEQKGVHGFAPFKDPNPAASGDARYKAVGAVRRACSDGLYAMGSTDGLKWSLLSEEPILEQGKDGKFDSQNLAFWDPVREQYRAYVRQGGPAGRDIATAMSEDFIHWTDSELLEYPGAPGEQLYTNQITPYPRAPHLLMGFPTRYVEREWSSSIEQLPEREHRRRRSNVRERYGTALTDGLFMTSRDGRTFNRWGEAFMRPGPQLEGNWAYGDNYQAWGMLETDSSLEGAPQELSFYATENYWRQPSAVRRYSLRKDGFVSVHAPRSGGEVLTKPLIFQGNWMEINFSTSAAGSLKIEIQGADGMPVDGFTVNDCVEQIGDELDRTVKWQNGDDLSELRGKPVRLRIVLTDADLYAIRFK
ncbi:MAG: hypothetical protein KGZ25_11950 [Planctomycetes bacterium]|nr:hypothetical protein [Planctomycetota bacterium]